MLPRLCLFGHVEDGSIFHCLHESGSSERAGHAWSVHVPGPQVNVYIVMETIFHIARSTISMALSNIYVELPEGIGKSTMNASL